MEILASAPLFSLFFLPLCPPCSESWSLFFSHKHSHLQCCAQLLSWESLIYGHLLEQLSLQPSFQTRDWNWLITGENVSVILPLPPKLWWSLALKYNGQFSCRKNHQNVGKYLSTYSQLKQMLYESHASPSSQILFPDFHAYSGVTNKSCVVASVLCSFYWKEWYISELCPAFPESLCWTFRASKQWVSIEA